MGSVQLASSNFGSREYNLRLPHLDDGSVPQHTGNDAMCAAMVAEPKRNPVWWADHNKRRVQFDYCRTHTLRRGGGEWGQVIAY